MPKLSKFESRTCLVSCSALKEEIQQLVKQGDIEADLVFVSKYFHVEYEQIERNLRPVVEKAMHKNRGNVVLVYGDLCLGMNNEMKKLAEEYGITKVDALNCVDCQLGGKGKFAEADPNHDLIFLSPGMTNFFEHAREAMHKEGMDDEQLKQLFNGLRGIVLIDTLGNAELLKREVENLNIGLPILETLHVGLENVKNVINEALETSRKKQGLDSS